VRIDKQYRFDTDQGTSVPFLNLFGRTLAAASSITSCFGPDYTGGVARVCSAIADGFNGFRRAFGQSRRRVLRGLSRAPLPKTAKRTSRGWAGASRGASSFDSDFNHDFQAAYTKEQWESGAVESNFSTVDLRPVGQAGSELDEYASSVVGTGLGDVPARKGPGVERIHALRWRGLPHLLGIRTAAWTASGGMYQWLDRAPLGRNEDGRWHRRHDEYDNH